jgi:hypothetical protein
MSESNPIAPGCVGEMVSNEHCVMDGELMAIAIDPDIRNREWGPILQNPAIVKSPTAPAISNTSAQVPTAPPDTDTVKATDHAQQETRLLDCQGLILHGLTKRVRTDNIDQLKEGYRLVIAEAMHNRATAISRDLTWPLDPRLYDGVLDSSADKRKIDL